jgi:hypothetical protein
MTSDPLIVFRTDLRAAAARQASAYQRRRRAAVVAGVALFAVLSVGGAIAEKSTWFNTASHVPVRFTAAGRAAALDYPARGYAKCMAARGSRRVRVQGGGWSYQPNAAAEATCKPYLEALAATCRIPRQPGERVTAAAAAACVSKMRHGDPAAH